LRDGRVVALSADDGHPLWQVEAEAIHAPAVADAMAYVVTASALEARSLASGDPVWRLPLPSPPASAPIWWKGRAVVTLDSGESIAVEGDGTEAWRLALGNAPSLAPAIADDQLYAGLSDGRVVAVDARSGRVAWERQLGGPVRGLLAAGRSVFAGSEDNFLYCLSADKGRVRWRWRTGGDVIGPAGLDAKRVYFASLDNLLRALDRGHGAQRWKRPLPTRPLGGPLLVGDTLIVSGVAPVIQGFVADTGEPAGRLTFSAELAFAAVASADAPPGGEWLVVLTRDGKVHRLSRKTAPVPSPSPPPPTSPSGLY
jgi:outer membrane protein assembly factor BamB